MNEKISQIMTLALKLRDCHYHAFKLYCEDTLTNSSYEYRLDIDFNFNNTCLTLNVDCVNIEDVVVSTKHFIVYTNFEIYNSCSDIKIDKELDDIIAYLEEEYKYILKITLHELDK